MDKVTQQNAANAEESASASEELTGQAESMNDIVAELVLLAGGTSRRSSSTSSQTPARQRQLGQSDHILHTIATSENKQKPRGSKAHQKTTIPLNDNDDMDHFNT